jgi:Tol biopolymer transport system component
VKVTQEGKVKILDFGLAKAFQEEPIAAAPDLSKSPTLTDQMTRPGAILGTAAYMSPEQARSQSVDKRTDIWAFGCVLYECLTGRPVLQGETVTDTLALILKGEPDWIKLPPNTPHAIRTLLRRCLQKDPKNRIHDIADARIEMEEIDTALPEEVTAKTRFPLGWILPICAASVLIGVLFGFFLKGSRSKSLPHSPVRSVIKTEPGYVLAPQGERFIFNWPTRTAFTISNDGRFIVYSAVNNNADSDAKPQLFMRRLNEQKATPIPGTEGGIAPFLSPDNRWIGFWRDQKLWKVQIDGGVPQELCEALLSFGASWGENGQIVFTGSNRDGLHGISSNGGTPEVLTEPDSEKMEVSHRLPYHLPDGKDILFTIMKDAADFEPRISIFDSQSGKWRELLENASDARYISTGHILFLRQGTLMAVPFDLKKLEIIGQPVAVIPDVLHILNATNGSENTASGQISISDSGRLIYVSGGTNPDLKNMLVWIDHDGNLKPVCSQIKPFFSPRLSPDGKSVLYNTMGKESSIGIYDIDRDIHSTIISGSGSFPLFSPSGNEIVFTRKESKPHADIFIKATKGDTKIKPLIESQYPKRACSFSPDGNLLAYIERKNGNDILIYDFRDQSSTPFAATEHHEMYPEFSPNGRWIAYCTNEEGRRQVYVRHFSGTGETVKISRDGGCAPLWARSGKKLFYLSDDFSQVWVTEVLDNKTPTFGRPRLLFEHEIYGLFVSVPIRGHDISLDDQRFLTHSLEDRQPRPVTEMILIQNWFEELKRLVPTEK